MKSNRYISDSITDMKNMTSLQVFKTTMQYRLERGRECRYANGLGILELDGKRCELKNRKKDRTYAARYLYIHPTFPYRIKRKIVCGDLLFSSDATTQRCEMEHRIFFEEVTPLWSPVSSVLRYPRAAS
jgi:hypothetical protein